MEKNWCQCECGHTAFEVKGKPSLRMICHCTICQKFNGAPHADILAYKTKQVKMPAEDIVIFTTYKRPPNVQRGKCAKCQQAAIEVFDMPLFPKLTMVPVSMLPDQAILPEPAAHMFYEKRVADAQDDIAKRHGFIASQLTFFKCLWFG